MSSRPKRMLLGRAAIVALVVIVAVVAAVRVISVRRSSEPVSIAASITSELAISGPEYADAGEGFEVSIAGIAAGAQVELLVDGGYGPRRFVGRGDGGDVTMAVPAAVGPEAGEVLLHAVSGGGVGTTTINIRPGESVNPLDLYLGPRTVVADTEHLSMIVAVPKDRFGNPVEAGTNVEYLVTRPSRATETAVVATKGLLAFTEVWSGTVTGRTRLSAVVGDAHGPERSFLEVAGTPVPFSIELLDPLVPADGASLLRVRTEALQDVFGNSFPDGTIVLLDASGATGQRRQRAVTIDSIAEFVLEVPDTAGQVSLAAFASGRRSAELTVEFESAVEMVPVQLLEHPDGTEVQIGRVIASQGSYVPDGTLALVSTPDGDFEAQLADGAATVVVPETRGPVQVSVLGVANEVAGGPGS